MFTDMERDEEIGEDARHVERNEDDNGIVTPFAGQETLQATPAGPNPGILTVDGKYVLADVVCLGGKRIEVRAIRWEEWSVDGRWANAPLRIVHTVSVLLK